MAKVIFLPLFVILFTGGGGLPQCMLGYHPLEQTPPGPDLPPTPRADTPLDPPPPGADTPWTRHPPEQTPPPGTRPNPRNQTPPYGLRAAGTHPTGMHSCISTRLSNLFENSNQNVGQTRGRDVRRPNHFVTCQNIGFNWQLR